MIMQQHIEKTQAEIKKFLKLKPVFKHIATIESSYGIHENRLSSLKILTKREITNKSWFRQIFF